MIGEFPDDDQRYAVCVSLWKAYGPEEGGESIDGGQEKRKE